MDHRNYQKGHALKKILISIKLFALIMVLILTTLLNPVLAQSKYGKVMFKAQTDFTYKLAASMLMHDYLNKFSGYGINSAVSLGDTQKYDQALNNVNLVIDPKLTSVAKYDPNNNTVYLSKDPLTVSDGEKLSLGQSIWHELTHKIEDDNGDVGYFDSDDYKERNIEYMTYVADVALNTLRVMEDKASQGASATELKSYWQKFLQQMESAKNLSTNKPDMQTLKSWFGFEADVDSIKRYYASGAAGSALQSAVTESTTQPGGNGSSSGTFPSTPFNGMQITYSIGGVTVTDSKDEDGFTTSRTLKGTLGTGNLVLSGSAKMGNGYGADVKVTLSCGGQSKDFSTYIESGYPSFNEKSFNLEIPIPADATSGQFSINMTGFYNAGTRGLVVSGTFTRAVSTSGAIRVILNGSELKFDVAPIIENGRTLVPLRKITEALGSSVVWNQANKSITVTKGNTKIYLQVNNKTATVNGKSKILDVPPRIINSRTLIPLRFLSETLGLKVSWDGTNKIIKINS